MRHLRKILAGVLSIAIVATGLYLHPSGTSASGGSPGIRQEINIIDGYLGSLSGSFATSSAIVQFDGTKYTAPSAYFEVVASTSASISTQVFLRNATSSATVATINIPSGTTAYTRLRSTELTALASTTQGLVVVVASTTGATKGVLAARIVVIDAGSPLSNQETQIEIGNQETYTSNATSTFASPKYWYYNAAGWDGSPTFYAEVTYANTIEPGGFTLSTTTYTASQSVALSAANQSTKVMLWGGGGAGGPAAANPSGGDGGAGGQFAQSTITGLAGLTKTLTIGGTTAGGSSGASSAGADTTWDSTVVVAKGGAGGNQVTASTTGSTTGCVGSDFCVAGGNGGKGTTTYGAGGGGGPGVNATGNSATAAGVAGTASTDGNGGAGGAKNTTSKSNGNQGGIYGSGGGGAFRAGAGGTVTGGTGQAGKAIIVEKIGTQATTTITIQEDNGQFGSWADVTGGAIVAQGAASSPTRVRSAAFTPHDGMHYRIVFSNGYNGATFAIYNAKIIVDQGGTISTSIAQLQDAGTTNGVAGIGGTSEARGQSFTTDSNTWTINDIQLKDWKANTPADALVVKLYSDSAFTTLLATSNQVAAASIAAAAATTTYTFASPPTVSPNTIYYFSLSRTGARDTGNFYEVQSASNLYSGGTQYDEASSVWSSNGAQDLTFKIDYTSSVTASLLEPQYLLANTKLASGTGLQNYLQNFDITEWTTTNNYLHAVSSGPTEASTIEVDNTSGPAQITGSVVTSPNNYATSTGMCLTSSATLDTKATTNGGNVYGDSIIVQVGVASTASCGGGTPTAGVQTLTFRDGASMLRDANLIVRDH